MKKWMHWGAGLRARQYLILGAKARAILRGRFNASCEDVRAVIHSDYDIECQLIFMLKPKG